MSIYLGETPLANNAVSRNIGEIIQSTIPLSDAGLHLLDGALTSNVGSYAKFVNYIAGLVTDYPDLFTTEADWQSSVSTYGVCGKFVYDSTNNTVRLPKITGFVEGTIDPTVLGDLVQAGLPNITGNVTLIDYGTGMTSEGALKVLFNQYQNLGGTSGRNYGKLTIDASRSSSIYGNSSTVQPQSIKVLYYIVIANSVKTNIEVDIDEIATDLNGKADVDLSNVNASGTSFASGWSMPSSRYIDLTLGASGATYTAPANGWVFAEYNNNSGQYFILSNSATTIRASAQSVQANIFIPVKKGESFYCSYSGNTSQIVKFKFIYTIGEE